MISIVFFPSEGIRNWHIKRIIFNLSTDSNYFHNMIDKWAYLNKFIANYKLYKEQDATYSRPKRILNMLGISVFQCCI